LAECIDAVPVVVHPQRRNGGVCREAGSRANAHTPPKKAEASIAPSRRANTAAPKDRGYNVTSALALAVEAVEALCTFLSDCDPGLTAAVRPFGRAAL